MPSFLSFLGLFLLNTFCLVTGPIILRFHTSSDFLLDAGHLGCYIAGRLLLVTLSNTLSFGLAAVPCESI